MKNNARTRIQLPLALAACLAVSQAPAQTWQTVDSLPGGNANGITHDPAGNIYAAGYVKNPLSGYPLWYAVVQKSADGGLTWNVSDSFAGGMGGLYYAITSDSLGNIYAVGYQNPGTGISWLVRQSADAGNTWSTIDTLSATNGTSYAESVSTDATGNVYVAGYSNASNGGQTWLVRKGTNVGGSWSWTTVDSFSPYNNGIAWAVFCHPNGSVFVTGQAGIATKKGTAVVWTTRRSLDGGNTWATVDTYTAGSQGRGLGCDGWGNLYAVGMNGIRRSTDNGNTWTTVDTAISANGFSRDAYGNLFVVGYGCLGPYGGQTWTVRESVAGTGAWTTVDCFQLSSATANARGAMSDAAGHTYVVGWASNNWIVRER